MGGWVDHTVNAAVMVGDFFTRLEKVAKATAAFNDICKRSIFPREAHENNLSETLEITNQTTRRLS